MTHKEREDRFRALSRIGCIVCLIYYGARSEPHIHHLTGLKYRATGKKADDTHTIPLCPCHHQHGNIHHPSVHGQPAEFESRFGTQEELLSATNKMIEALA